MEGIILVLDPTRGTTLTRTQVLRRVKIIFTHKEEEREGEEERES